MPAVELKSSPPKGSSTALEHLLTLRKLGVNRLSNPILSPTNTPCFYHWEPLVSQGVAKYWSPARDKRQLYIL